MSKQECRHVDWLVELFRQAVEAAQPSCVMPKVLAGLSSGRTVVVGAGKAAAAMAAAVERCWSSPLEGMVVTRYGHSVPCERIKVMEAGHPIPDENSVEAACRILELVQGLRADDLVLVLISGGASSLLSLPASDISLADKQWVNRALLASGATIHEINCVRKHISAIKGGRLAVAAYPAKVVALIISDVPGDDPAVIASGPTVADPSSHDDALAMLTKYRIDVPESILQHLRNPHTETPKPGDMKLATVDNRVIATASRSLAAAAQCVRDAGMNVLVLGDMVEGEAREVARAMAGIAKSCALHGVPVAAPCVLMSGGETSVTIRGAGRGGRNAEFVLSLAIALQACPGIYAIACDTDGIDGTEDNAGALITPDTLQRAKALGMDPAAYLAANDAYSFFSCLGDLVVTGPSLTNVNDFRAILIEHSL